MGTPNTTAKAATAETAARDLGKAKEGAQSVAEAVKRVADAAVAEVSKIEPVDQDLDFRFSGVRGGRFVIEGPAATFGASGTVKIGQAQLTTLSWSAQRIEGFLPADVPTGDVIVETGGGKTARGRFRG